MPINEKMIAIMRDIGAIRKDSRNSQQNFNFRGIDTVYNELHDIMAKHGVYSMPEVLDVKCEERQTKSGGNLLYRVVTIKYHFIAEDGTRETCTVIGEGMDSGDKASSKAMSIAHKYALLQVFCIPTVEAKDPDAESWETAPKQPPKAPAATQTTPPPAKVPETKALSALSGILARSNEGHYKDMTFWTVEFESGEKASTKDVKLGQDLIRYIGCEIEIPYTVTPKGSREFTSFKYVSGQVMPF